MYQRIISIFTYNQGCLYRTKNFVPDYPYTSNFLDFWSIDEIIVLDISREPEPSRHLFYEALKQIASQCFVPLSAGGGIRDIQEADNLFRLGADKIVLNTQALRNPDLISTIAKKYGSQAVVVSIDAKKDENGLFTVYSHFGQTKTEYSPEDWAKKAVAYGAGEILINSIDEDGSLNGYDHPLCESVIRSVSVPVLISGGAGNWKHFEHGFSQLTASGVCTTNIYHFTETAISNAKQYLSKKGIEVRL